MGTSVKTPKADIGGDIDKYVSGYVKALPKIIGSEREYRPQFMGLNLGDINSFLQGAGGQEGYFGLGRIAQRDATQALTEARGAEFANMAGMAPQFRTFAQTLSPESQAQVEAARAEAQRATASARSLTPEEQRSSEQAAREAFGARGMLNSNQSIAGELLNREGVLAQKRQEADAARTRAFGMAQDFYTVPGLQALGSAPLSYQAGQQQLQMGLGAIGSATPQMINPDTGVNIGAQNRANTVAGRSAQASANGGMWGGLFSGLGRMIPSDRRVKTDINRIGTTAGGFPIYTFRYKWSDATNIGVMAQDVEAIDPSAVQEIGGIKHVDYSKIQ
jgi:hypothetical protein